MFAARLSVNWAGLFFLLIVSQRDSFDFDDFYKPTYINKPSFLLGEWHGFWQVGGTGLGHRFWAGFGLHRFWAPVLGFGWHRFWGSGATHQINEIITEMPWPLQPSLGYY